MDKYVEDILSKSQYGQKRMISLVNLSMDKNIIDILRKSQYGQNVEDILSKSQYGQKRRGYYL